MSALLALLKQKQQDMAASRRGRTEKLPDGNSRWRIMPSWRSGEGQPFWHDFGQHFVKGADGKIAAIYLCTDKTFGKPCQVCDAVAMGLKGATDDATMKLLGDAKSAGRVLVNAVHLDMGGDATKVVILELPPTVFEQVVSVAAEWEEAGESILGASGRDIIINRTGTGKNTKYTTQAAAKSMPVAPETCKKLNDLDAYVAQESSEQQARALNSVRSLAGMLPAPTTGGGAVPAGVRGATTLEDDDLYAAAPAPTRRPVEAEDAVARPPSKPAAAPANPATAGLDEVPWEEPGSAAPAPAPAAESTGDADLDALLAGL